MDQETLQECLVAQIRDIYDAEKQLTKALPKMAKAASSDELETAFRDHLTETQGQVGRLDKVFEALGVAAKGKPCKGMKGLIEEGGEAISEEEEGPMRDLALIAAAQKVEHYEISAYGTARTLAEQIGNDEAAQLLQETEEEEKAADSKLTDIAMSLYAMKDEEASSDEEDEESVDVEDDEEAATPSRRQPAAAAAGRSTQRSRTASR